MVISFAKGVPVGAGGSVQTGTDGTPHVATLGSPQLGAPKELSVGVHASDATTITINVSYDGQTWLAATVHGTLSSATITTSGAGGQSLRITPAPYVQVASSAAVTLSAWAYTS